ncbi:sulfotransferase [Halioglobus maricola]|uniref:Sulfotransferase n=1 Tax=Halioglobus maricola TaxID=2601894 RepID=A0A5P9NL84_9GAMM|nr:sulfotransferase domain-containing protein [Halioglobus maricola]QFU76275.1 sulfotransferase [Halioglobus maricola]
MSNQKPRRARTLEEFIRISSLAAQGPSPNYRPYEPGNEDVFISSWAKSGTTLLQQMFHQIRTAATGGDMDFDDISRVVPWEDTAQMVDLDMQADQRAIPRGFKSHREYERLPAGMRYVIALRDPKETFVSFYRFFNGWHLERDALPLEDFMPLWMGGGPGGCDYFSHLLSWFPRRDENDTLLVTYDWVTRHREKMARQLAQFCRVELDEAQLSMVVQRTSREYMYTHKDRFDDAMIVRAMEERSGLPPGSDSSKVQATGSNAHALPDSIASEIDRFWEERVLPATGHANFASLANAVDNLPGNA